MAGQVAAVEPFASVIRLAWAVFLMNVAARGGSRVPDAKLGADSKACLDKAVQQNAFHFLVHRILRTPTFKVRDFFLD